MNAPAAPTALRAEGFRTLHGFTTRVGGVSGGAYAGLNLGLSSGDARPLVERNRDLVLEGLGFTRERVCAFDQVHGDRVLPGDPGWFTERADAAVTDRSGVLLVVSVADCVPLLFFDEARGVIGAAHAGWRGTAKLLAAGVVKAMAERHGTDPAAVRVAIGPCMRGACYQVGPEVVEEFALAGFPGSCWREDPAAKGRHLLDLPAANAWVLQHAGVPAGNITDLGLCTHCEPELFYSHRRDAGVTGRHWAYVALAEERG